MKTQKIAILMTVHNRKEKTLCCMDRIYKLDVPDETQMDVFVTDDGCTDGTAEAIKLQYPKVNVLQGDGTLFWNRGMVFAWKEAAKHDYDYYLWLNDDTFIYPDLINVLLETALNVNNEGVVVGATCVPQTNNFSYGGRLLNGHAVKPNGSIQDVELANGNIVLIPRKVFDAVGIMDPYYRHDKGDSDYSLLVREHGFRLVQAPKFLGECERHDRLPKWMDPQQPLSVRWKSLYSVMGPNPREVFYYEKKHFGMVRAIKKVLATYLRCVCPKFFVWTGKEKKLYGIQIDLIHHGNS